MKKLLTLLLTFMMTIGCVFGLTACGAGGVNIGGQSGTTGLMYAECLKGCNVSPYDTFALAAQDLKNGKVDYVIVDGATGESLVKDIDGLKLIKEVPLSSEYYGIAVDKSQATLLADINGVLESKATEINAIIQKYLNGETEKYATYESPEIDLDNQAGQLVMATNAEFPPFEYLAGNKYTGIDVEIAMLIAQELNLELVIKDMLFDAVVTSVGNNGIDIGMSGLTITAERKKTVNFTNSYYIESQYVLTVASNTKLDDCMTIMDVLSVLTANK